MGIGTNGNCTDHGCSHCIGLNDKYNQLLGRVQGMEDRVDKHIVKFEMNMSSMKKSLDENSAKIDELTSTIGNLSISFQQLNIGINERVAPLVFLLEIVPKEVLQQAMINLRDGSAQIQQQQQLH